MTDLSGERSGPGDEADMTCAPQALVAAVRDLAEQQGLTLTDVARRAGLGNLLARVESGEAELLVSDVASFGQVLGVSASSLIARAEALAREEGQP